MSSSTIFNVHNVSSSTIFNVHNVSMFTDDEDNDSDGSLGILRVISGEYISGQNFFGKNKIGRHK